MAFEKFRSTFKGPSRDSLPISWFLAPYGVPSLTAQAGKESKIRMNL